MLDSVEDEDAEWVVEADRKPDAGRTVRYRPVDVASFAEPLLFHYGRTVLLMSATVLNVPTFLRTLGIRETQAAHVQVPSTFPPERRPVHLRPVADLRRATQARDLPKLVGEIAQIMEDHPFEKGVIHAHSYKIARAIADGLPPHLQQRLRMHDAAAGRDDALRYHRTSGEPTVLLSPSMTEGVNLAGDDARFQVLCKVPWPYLGDKQVAARKDRDPEWYAWQAAVRLVQSYGRSVRSEDDHAVTYLLDATFAGFVKRQAHLLPVWFHEAMVTQADSVNLP
jgi:Rad3-related DNA helicase